ncbi:hypothetical protein K457DRAFT_1876098 [Linnemannia elongata AG-77]|uniref:Uncharacterized protein n=1 Tax=Linnemannia elongata AG-77 TaxID=1314771 RepID=A0A197JVF4_9FUNG|nr:hypothetical protein K457DRAFT_1876098 [Linnemannia elongata AG-77]
MLQTIGAATQPHLRSSKVFPALRALRSVYDNIHKKWTPVYSGSPRPLSSRSRHPSPSTAPANGQSTAYKEDDRGSATGVLLESVVLYNGFGPWLGPWGPGALGPLPCPRGDWSQGYGYITRDGFCPCGASLATHEDRTCPGATKNLRVADERLAATIVAQSQVPQWTVTDGWFTEEFGL